MKIFDKVEKIKIKNIYPYHNNPKTHPPEQIDKLCSSIKNYGFTVPIVIDGDNEIIAGHGRYKAAQKLGLEELPVIRRDDLTDAEAKALRIADNKVAESEWDMEMLEVEFEAIEDEFTGFELEELEFEDNTEVEEDDFDAEIDDNTPTITERGDVIELGSHRLMCGDSTKERDIEQLMDGSRADMVITDPPYNVAVNDESKESLKARNRRTDGLKIENDNMTDEDFNDFLLKIFNNYYKNMKNGAGIYVFYADSETIPFLSNFIDADFHFAQNIIWNKQQFVMTRKDYHYKHEPIIYGWKKGKAHNWYSDRKQSSVWDFDRPFRNEFHPTMKPLPLISYPIKNSSKKEDIVLDLFGGSGSTLIAAEQLDRTCYMMELDEHYCDVIIRRYINYRQKENKPIEIKVNGEEIDYNKYLTE